ncbi:MAG: ATP phosphoribosyltransferase [Pseudomonadota bacterium]|nr:ATP phosphoribosyltransferase [Pseudomonadota bacterium]
MNESRIKIAIQKSGRLTEHCMELLQQCGLKYSRGKDQLIGFGENMPVDFLLVRDDDIPGLVKDDVCDLGICGLNVLEEKRFEYIEAGNKDPFKVIQKLDYGHCRLAFAYPENVKHRGINSLANKSIATSYPLIVKDFLKQNNINATVVEFSGAVEIAPSLGRSDLICDLISTGATLAANKLVEGETILNSVACLVQTPIDIASEKKEWVNRMIERIAGVQEVRGSKYIMMHAPRSALQEITSLLPGAESPTVLPLEEADGKVAVHVVCREIVFWETLEGLKQAGASSILVLPIEKMLA